MEKNLFFGALGCGVRMVCGALVLAAVAVSPARAETEFLWWGFHSSNWDQGNNWATGVAPGVNDDAHFSSEYPTEAVIEQSSFALISHLYAPGGNLKIKGILSSSGWVGTANVEIDGGGWNFGSLDFHLGYYGGNGTGVLTLKNNGHANIYGEFPGALLLGHTYEDSGTKHTSATINIGSAVGDEAAGPGVVNIPSIRSTNNDAASVKTVQFNHTATAMAPYYFTRTGAAGGEAVVIGDTSFPELSSDIRVVITAGDTVFSGQNHYRGGTYLNGGALHVSNDNQLGHSSSVLHFDGGTLAVSSAIDMSARSITWSEKGGNFALSNGVHQVVAQSVSGGALGVSGQGRLELTGTVNVASLNVTQSRVSLTKASTIGELSFGSGSGPDFRVESSAAMDVDSLEGSNSAATLSVDGLLTVKGGNYYGHVVSANFKKSGADDLYLGGPTQITALVVEEGGLTLTDTSNHQIGTVHVNGATAEFGMTHGGTVNGAFSVEQGRATITGSGQTATAKGAVTVSGTSAVMGVLAGGTLHLDSAAGNLVLANGMGTTGTLEIGGAPGDPLSAPGQVTAAGASQSIHGGSGTATVRFNHNAGSFTFGTGISGSTKVVLDAGTTKLEKAGSYSGGTEVNGGKLVISDVGAGSSVLGTGHVNVGAGGVLSGVGHVFGDTTVHGTLAPGNSPGEMSFGGALTLGAGSETVIEVAGTSLGEFDTIKMTAGLFGTITYGGTLQVNFTNGYLPGLEPVTLGLFLSDGLVKAGSFSAIQFNAPGYEGTFNYSTGELSVAAIPEPATFGLAGLSLAALMAFCRRRRLPSRMAVVGR